ncbi:MAG: pantoate--beta-alanine ligase [Methyloprofundus sp.]|nr:pantoate--beta-alanine ligase [Methyloprofundus sp.]
MQCITDIKALRELLKQWRSAGESIAFVPTMGNLHAGHLQLVNRAKAQADRVVVSIFVNPTQFGVGEDFSLYPRTEQADQEKLQAAAVDVVFMPSTEAMYPVNELTKVSVSEVSESHCGAARPGHFDGVATVVCKLFNIVQPDKAFFGEKDFQQLTVINAMVADLNLPVVIISVPTVRESNGLAMSSRNGYLTAQQREQASQLYQCLCAAKRLIQAKQLSYVDIEKLQIKFLTEQGFRVDYFSICRRSDLQAAEHEDAEIVILVAARIGKTRLIDNVQLDIKN